MNTNEHESDLELKRESELIPNESLSSDAVSLAKLVEDVFLYSCLFVFIRG